MNLLRDDPKKLFLHYWSAAFGSTFISCVYSMVDTAMVGQYHGPDGAAALAVVAPFWSLIFSLGLMTGVGGAVLYGTEKGRGSGRQNEYFTTALLLAILFAALAWTALLLFDAPLLRAFGGDDALLPLAQSYLRPIKCIFPLFLFNQLFAAFLRNDGRPRLATLAVLVGGVFNVFGDWFFVFALDLGAEGAGIATAGGTALTFLIVSSHFFSRRCTLRLARPAAVLRKLWQVVQNGFSSFMVDLALGALAILFNRQIVRYFGNDALAVYSVLLSVGTFTQCCAYSVGMAMQPIASLNYGAEQGKRVVSVLRCALWTAAGFGVLWLLIAMSAPNLLARIFMQPTEAVLDIAPGITRIYGLSFLLLPLNVSSTFYFQAILRPRTAFVISLGRGAVLSCALILLLPLLIGGVGLWWAMPLTEAITTVYVVLELRRSVRALHEMEEAHGK